MKRKRLLSIVLVGAMTLTLAASVSAAEVEDTEKEEEELEALDEENQAAEAEVAENEAEQATEVNYKNNPPEVLNVGTSEVLGNLQSYSNDSDAGYGLFLIYDESFYYDNNDEMVSDIITDYYFSDDGFTIYLTMRDDIVFSNGDAATGEDFLYSFTSMRDPDRNAITTAFDRFDMDSAYILDDGYTIALPTDGTAKAYSLLGDLVKVELLDKSWVEETGWNTDTWRSEPNGSGPYQVSDYVFGYSYQFTLRDDYWNKDADWYGNLPQTINVTSYEEMSTMFMDLETGAIDLAIEPDSTDLEAVVDGKYGDDIDYAFILGNCCNWMVFDYEGLFSDLNLRKAVAHGIVWDDVAYAGKGIKYDPATSSIPYYFPDYLDVGQYEYDPDYAKECLEAAGYDEGELTITMYIGPQAGSAASATVMQEYLRLIGINLEFEAYEMATVMPMWEAGEGDISSYAYQGGSFSRDAAFIFNELASYATMVDNRTISDTTIDDDIEAALLADSDEEAREYYYEIQQWIYDNYRVVSYMEEVNAACFNTDLIESVHFSSKVYPDLRFVVYADR